MFVKVLCICLFALIGVSFAQIGLGANAYGPAGVRTGLYGNGGLGGGYGQQGYGGYGNQGYGGQGYGYGNQGVQTGLGANVAGIPANIGLGLGR